MALFLLVLFFAASCDSLVHKCVSAVPRFPASLALLALPCVALLCFGFCKFFASHFGAPGFLLCVSGHPSVPICYLFIVYSFFLGGSLSLSLSLSLSRILVQKQKSSRALLEAHCLCLFVCLLFV